MDFEEQQIGAYLSALASKAAVPGGGGVSALTGALAAGLGQMVCSLTIGKKRYADVEEEICKVAEALETLRKRLVSCMKEDAYAFEPLSKAYGLPKDTEEQILYREQVMEDCLVRAAQPPLEICEAVAQMVPLICTAAEKGSKLAISDAGCAAVLAEAALKAAALNVTVNTRLMKNRETAAELDAQVEALLKEVPQQLESIYAQVDARLRG